MTTNKKQQEKLRATRAKVYSKRHHRLVGFLYDLLRDKITCGEAERLMQDVECISSDEKFVLTNEFLANYAQNLADRLMEEEE